MALKIGPLASTMKACGDAVDNQESTLLKALEQAQTFQIGATQLQINTKMCRADLVRSCALTSADSGGGAWSLAPPHRVALIRVRTVFVGAPAAGSLSSASTQLPFGRASPP